ncbi:MAG: hypothetical protein K1X88_14000 [Nannocystaceae bacterium]|nr:hypothetical protein [Nannocystaceae bacterium]
MIRVMRPVAEPPALVQQRQTRLTAARAALAEGSKIAFGGYDVAKPALAAMQHNKCCYCEKLEEQPIYRDVEHFRPKSRYWWLAWTWENLLFACPDCNRQHKRDAFPLAEESERLVAETMPPGGERPLLLDPASSACDPWTEIVFRPMRIAGRERWQPFGTTPRGTTTVEVCRLARPGLLDFYDEHVRMQVRPAVRTALDAHDSADARGVAEAWRRARRTLLGERKPFRALSRDAMNHLMGEDLCARYRLETAPP